MPPLATPLWHADKANHVDDGRQTHGKASKEETLRRVSDHGRPDLGVQRVAQQAQEKEQHEESHVQRKEDVRDVL